MITAWSHWSHHKNLNTNIFTMRHIDILTFYLVLKVSSVDATNDNDHPFIRRVQTNQLPQCGNPNLCWCDMNASTPPATECPPYPANSIYFQVRRGQLLRFFGAYEPSLQRSSALLPWFVDEQESWWQERRSEHFMWWRDFSWRKGGKEDQDNIWVFATMQVSSWNCSMWH